MRWVMHSASTTTTLESNMAVYPNDGHFDLDLKSSGDGWMGTFVGLVRTAAKDILSDGEPWGPAEVTYQLRNGQAVVAGILTDSDSNTLFVDDGQMMHSIDIDAVLRFRA